MSLLCGAQDAATLTRSSSWIAESNLRVPHQRSSGRESRACARFGDPTRFRRLDRYGRHLTPTSNRHQQGEDEPQQAYAGQDIEDRVQGQACTDQEAAEQRAANTAQPTETRAPGHSGAPDVGPVVVGHEAVDQGLGTTGA